MEMLLFIGIQATGKSTFYRQRFFRTHVRLNLDMLKTRHRETLLLKACLESKTPFVVENTNVTRQERARYIQPARDAGFRIIGYFFESRSADAIKRNRERPEPDRVPAVAIYTAAKRLELPSLSEGFDALHFVRLNGPDAFEIQEWQNEIQT
jgi:predicted kinase